jgi:putative addiction module component (TIGR02574 family)
MHAQDILQGALGLSETDRADLALRLLESLSPKDERSDAEWVSEIERRARRVLAGESKGSSWDDARSRIEAALSKK